MKLYWPIAIIKRGKEWDVQHTYAAEFSYEKAMDVIRIWRTHYKLETIMYRVDVTEDGVTSKGTLYVFLNLVKELWEDFGDVPMNPMTECIEDFWGKFRPGTHREEIWKWFEDTFHVSVAEDLM